MVENTYNNSVYDQLQCYYKYAPPSCIIYEGPTLFSSSGNDVLHCFNNITTTVTSYTSINEEIVGNVRVVAKQQRRWSRRKHKHSGTVMVCPKNFFVESPRNLLESNI